MKANKNKSWSNSVRTTFFYATILLMILIPAFTMFGLYLSDKTKYICLIDKRHIDALMAIDGLITTSTFAFIAFISISPNSSPSTYITSRMSWGSIKKPNSVHWTQTEIARIRSENIKNIKHLKKTISNKDDLKTQISNLKQTQHLQIKKLKLIYKYSKYFNSLDIILFKIKMNDFFVISVWITLINIGLMFISQYALIAGVVISGFILLCMIRRYVTFNQNPIKIACLIINDKLEDAFSCEINLKLHKQIVKYIHPLRGSTNADFFATLLKTPIFKKAVNEYIKKDLYENQDRTVELLSARSKVDINEDLLSLLDRLINVIAENDKLSPKTKYKLLTFAGFNAVKYNEVLTNIKDIEKDKEVLKFTKNIMNTYNICNEKFENIENNVVNYILKFKESHGKWT